MITISKRASKISDIEAKRIASELNTTTNVVKLLINRGYKEEELSKYVQNIEFYTESFNSLKNVDEAAEIIKSFLDDNKAEIYVYGDYDCDGVMSTTIANGVFSAIKESIESEVVINIKAPNRADGYGLSMEWCKKTFPRKTKKRILVMTVDNGITKKEEVEYLKSKGITVVVTDHHVPKVGETPDCLVVDAHLNDLDNPNSLGLCGAAVTYKVCGRLLELYEDDSNFVLNYLANAAIATITDMMPATQENIGMVGYGLWLMNNGYCNEALSYYKHYVNKDITVTDMAFEIGPQVNACGRMGQIEIANAFMSCVDEEELNDYYINMLNLNAERKEVEKSIVEALMVKDYSKDYIVIEHVPGLGGVGGTVASKLVEALGKPVILLGGIGDVLHGSARTANGLNLHTLFSYEVSKGNMVNFGGHEASAGVAIKVDKINDLRNSLNKTLSTIFNQQQEEIQSDINIEVDGIIDLKGINKYTAKPFSDMIFFGDLKEPVFAIKDIQVLEARSSANNPNHLCLNLQDDSCKASKNRFGKMVGKEIWMWNRMNDYVKVGSPKKVHLIGKLVPDFRNPNIYTFDVQHIIPA